MGMSIDPQLGENRKEYSAGSIQHVSWHIAHAQRILSSVIIVGVPISVII